VPLPLVIVSLKTDFSANFGKTPNIAQKGELTEEKMHPVVRKD